MFVVKKNNTKSFRHSKVVDNITEEELDELFADDNEVFSMVKLTKETALEVQKAKDIENLHKQQQEIQAKLAKLSGQGTPESPAPVVAPRPEVHFLSEEEKNKADPTFTPATPTVVAPPKENGENIKVEGQPYTIKKDTYPMNPETRQPYTKQEYHKMYNEFKDMAERREEVFGVIVGPDSFTVQLTGDIKLATTHRGIPLKKQFV